MPIPEQALRRYISESASVEVSDASIARLTAACDVAQDGLQALVDHSLFDTEPEQLHTVLESLAGDSVDRDGDCNGNGNGGAPAMSSELTHMSMVDVAQAIRDGEVSSREVTQACIARIEQHAPNLNCFISFDPQQGLLEADAADAHRAAGKAMGLLHGVPLAHKDMYYRKGIVTTCGSKIRRDFRPDCTATALTRLSDAGALHLGGLNMSEFASSPTGHNSHFGAARNPWNTDYITCGSSSGSGSATAGRLVFGALGSDTGGSIRLPATACGLVGIKPTQTRVSRYGAMGLSFSLDNVGPLTRTVRDCARMLSIIAGHDPLDATSSRRSVADYEAATLNANIKGLRIGVPTNYYDDVHDEVASALEQSLLVLESLGALRVPIVVPFHDHLAGLGNLVSGTESATLHSAWLRERPQDYGPQVRARLEMGLSYSATQYLRAIQARPGIIREFVTQVFSACDVMLVPGIPVPLPTIAETDLEDAQGFAQMLAKISRCTRPFNYLGLPGLSLPAGFSRNGLPVGFQLVGRPFAEQTLFRAGAAYEQATDWTQRAPQL
jgi:aspartyl-tRNA(Asn)/glutamyl-tRNA(Gln) amidotransferase subunit A